MGIKAKVEYVQVKLTLPASLAAELRAVRDEVERRGLQFSLEDEIAAALSQMRRQLAGDGNGPEEVEEEASEAT